MLSVERDLLSVDLVKSPTVETKATLEKIIQGADTDIARYEKEKTAIQSTAEALQREQSALKRQGGNYGVAVMFFQISILLSSIGALMRRKLPWIVGLVVGTAGLLYFVNGFLLFF